MTRSSAWKVSLRTSSINWLKSSSLLTGLSGMWMRPMWLVTPIGRMSSNSGCTDVFVEGAITPNLQRHANASPMLPSLSLLR